MCIIMNRRNQLQTLTAVVVLGSAGGRCTYVVVGCPLQIFCLLSNAALPNLPTTYITQSCLRCCMREQEAGAAHQLAQCKELNQLSKASLKEKCREMQLATTNTSKRAMLQKVRVCCE